MINSAFFTYEFQFPPEDLTFACKNAETNEYFISWPDKTTTLISELQYEYMRIGRVRTPDTAKAYLQIDPLKMATQLVEYQEKQILEHQKQVGYAENWLKNEQRGLKSAEKQLLNYKNMLANTESV